MDSAVPGSRASDVLRPFSVCMFSFRSKGRLTVSFGTEPRIPCSLLGGILSSLLGEQGGRKRVETGKKNRESGCACRGGWVREGMERRSVACQNAVTLPERFVSGLAVRIFMYLLRTRVCAIVPIPQNVRPVISTYLSKSELKVGTAKKGKE